MPHGRFENQYLAKHELETPFCKICSAEEFAQSAFREILSAFHFVGSKECCLHTVFSRVKEKQIGGLQCLFVDFLVALHDTFAKAFRIEAWQRTDFTNIHNIIL